MLKGKYLEYFSFDPSNPSKSMIVGGNWNWFLHNHGPGTHTGDANFQLFYREKNLIPEGKNYTPEGSVREFRITLVEKWYVDINPD